MKTERERELIAETDPEDPQPRRVVIAHARTRIEDELSEDLAILATYSPELFDAVRESVETADPAGTIERLTRAVENHNRHTGPLTTVTRPPSRGCCPGSSGRHSS